MYRTTTNYGMGRYENIDSLIERSARDVKNGNFEERSPDYMDEDILYLHEADKIPEIYASKMYANIICFCMEGSMDVMLNGQRQTIESGEVLVCPSTTVVERPMISPNFKFTFIAFTDKLLRELLKQNTDLWNKAAYIRKGHVVRPTDEDERDLIELGGMHMTGLLKIILRHRQLVFRREIICSVLQIVLLAYCSLQRKIEREEEEGAEKPHNLASTTIFNNFMTLLRHESKKHRQVSYYADQLAITPKHLTFVCNQVSGKPATELIQSAVTEEIIQYLRNPDYTVKQISELLGFPNLSFFGKFVKKHLGVSPNEYRRQLTQ